MATRQESTEREIVSGRRRLAPSVRASYVPPPIVQLPYSEDKSLMFFGEGSSKQQESKRKNMGGGWNPESTFASSTESLWERPGETEEAKRILRAVVEHKKYLKDLRLRNELMSTSLPSPPSPRGPSPSFSFPMMQQLSSLPPPSQYDHHGRDNYSRHDHYNRHDRYDDEEEEVEEEVVYNRRPW